MIHFPIFFPPEESNQRHEWPDDWVAYEWRTITTNKAAHCGHPTREIL